MEESNRYTKMIMIIVNSYVCNLDFLKYKKLLACFSSKTTILLSPQIKLWEGGGLENKRSIILIKSIKNLYLFYVIEVYTWQLHVLSTMGKIHV